METPTENANALLDELSDNAQKIGTNAQERVHSEIDERKGGIVGQAKTLSASLDAVADDLAPDSSPWIKSAIKRAASSLDNFAESVDQKSSRQITRDVQMFARDNPTTFLLGCAVAGFAAARVFKAGSSDVSRVLPASGQANQSGSEARTDPPGYVGNANQPPAIPLPQASEPQLYPGTAT